MKYLNLFLLTLLFVPTSFAKMEMETMNHHEMANHQMMSASSMEYHKANMAMHNGMNIEFSGDADIDFLRGMIPHHQGAVDMANVQLKHGQDGWVKHLTNRIIRDQKREMVFMKRHLKLLERRRGEIPNAINSPSTMAYEMANHKMHRDMNIQYTENADIDFVAGMIPHHEGAVDMAKIALQYGNDPNVRNLAHGIISAQESEINWMKKWQKRLRLMRIFR